MKTNHGRGFVARPDATSMLPQTQTDWLAVTVPLGKKRNWSEKLELSGRSIDTYIHPNGGDHSEEKCRRGAKRNMNRRARKFENAATKRLAEENDGTD